MPYDMILYRISLSCFLIFIIIYGLWKILKSSNVPKGFILSLFSTDPKSPSTTRFVFILSGISSTFCLWTTWVICQLANIYYTHSEDVVTMVDIPSGVYWAYAIALVGPGAVRMGQSVWGKKVPCQDNTTEENDTEEDDIEEEKSIEDIEIEKFNREQKKKKGK